MFFFFSSRRRHTRYWRDWSSDVCSSDLPRRWERRHSDPSRARARGPARRLRRGTAMGERLAGRVAVVIGGGQTPGGTIGNGRATSILFAREGARVVVVDRDLESADATVAMIRDEGGEAVGHAADITDGASCATIAPVALDRYGALDVLHNNVGIGAGDGPASRVDEDAWQ